MLIPLSLKAQERKEVKDKNGKLIGYYYRMKSDSNWSSIRFDTTSFRQHSYLTLEVYKDTLLIPYIPAKFNYVKIGEKVYSIKAPELEVILINQ